MDVSQGAFEAVCTLEELLAPIKLLREGVFSFLDNRSRSDITLQAHRGGQKAAEWIKTDTDPDHIKERCELFSERSYEVTQVLLGGHAVPKTYPPLSYVSGVFLKWEKSQDEAALGSLVLSGSV